MPVFFMVSTSPAAGITALRAIKCGPIGCTFVQLHQTRARNYTPERTRPMHEIKYPYFKRDRILKIEMLENFRDFPRDVLDVYNADMSDGIVCGLDPTVDKNIITFSKGIVKYNGEMYVFHDPTIIDYGATETDVVIKLSFLDETGDKDYRITPVDIVMDKGDVIEQNEIELGRFKLKTGAYLRSDYQDLYDFTTEYNTINIVNVLYAGFKQPTLSHLILKYFAREVLEVRPENMFDINFCMLCLNSRRIERETILSYIGYKIEREIDSLGELSNIDVHTTMVKILEDIKRESAGLRKRQSARKKVILD